jgi:cell wall-associated NlpC family hydrolase
MISLHSFSEIKSIDLHLSHSISLSNSSLPHFEQYFIINLLNLYNSNIYRLLYHSTIFRTIDENVTGNANKYGIRNSSYADIANAYNVGGIKGVGNSLSSFITSKDLDNIKEFNRLVSEEGVSSQTAWYKTMQTSSSAAKELFDNEENLIKSGNSVILSEETISNATNTMTFSAKAGQVALKGLALAGNMVVGILAGFVISKAIEGLDNLVHAADNAKESAEGFASSFSSMNDEFSSNDSKLSDLQKQYDELSKGVNSLGENVSLTTDQYDEYKQVVSEISDMMPSLLARYDDEGNKIGFVQGKLSNLNAEYDKYKKNKAMDLVNGENDNGDSIKDVFDNYQYQTAHTDANGNVVGKRKMFGDSNYEKILALQSEIDSGYDGIFGQNKLTNEDIEKKTALIQKYQSEIDASVSAIQNALSAIAQSGDEYYKLSDQEQQFLDTYINSLSQDFIDENNLTNETTARTFINNLINDIESGKPEIMKAYNDLFSFNIDDTDLSPEEVQKKVNKLIQQLAKALGEDNWQDLKIRLGFEFVDDNVKDYEDTINRFNDPDKIKQFFNTEGINTSDEVKQFNDLTKGINDADKAIQTWNEHKKEDNETPISFTDALNSSEYADIKEKLLDLAKSGEITSETLSSTQEYNALLEKVGISAESAKDQILDMLSAQERLAGAAQGLSKLKSAYEEFKNEDIGFVTAETLESLPDVFKNLPDFDLFSKIVGNPESGKEKIQQAFNDIVKSYLADQETLQGLVNADSATIQTYIANLKQMGITNAEEVIRTANEALNSDNEMINAAEKEYNKYLKGKLKGGEKFLESTASNNSKLKNALGSTYKSDYDNWCDLLSKKADAYNEFVKAIGGSYDDSKNVAQNLVANNGAFGANEYAEAQAAYDKWKQTKKQADDLKNSLKLDYSQITTDFGANWSPTTKKSKSKSKTKSDAAEVFDFIEIKLNNLADKASKAKDRIDDLLTFGQKKNQTKKAIEATTKAITAQEKAYKKYIAYANKTAKKQNSKKTTSSSSSSSGGNAVYDTATDYLGLKYVWGGASLTKGADCSGFTQQIYKKFGVSLPHKASYQAKMGTKITSKSDLQAGDLVFFGSKNNITHVGIYGGDGKFIESPHTGASVRVSKLSSRKDFVSGSRFSGISGSTKTSGKNVKKVKGVSSKTLEHYKRLIREGTLGSDGIASIKNENLKNALKDYQTYYEKAKACKEQVASLTDQLKDLYETLANNPIDNASDKIEKLGTKMDILNAKVGNLTFNPTKKIGTSDIDSLYKQIIKNYNSQLSASKTAYTGATKSYNSNKSSLTKSLKKTKAKNIGLTQKEFNSIKSNLKSNKSISYNLINKIENDTLREKCIAHNEYLLAKNTATDNYNQAKEDHTSNVRQARKDRFDKVQERYDNKAGLIEQKKNAVSNSLSIAEAKGQLIGEAYYTRQANAVKSDMKLKQEEAGKLAKKLSTIKFGSNEWYEAQEALNGVYESIQQDEQELAEFQKSINELKFDRFDELLNKLGDITDETDFLIDMLDSDNLFDSDTGMITDDGITAIGLTAQNYDTYLAEAQKYKDAIADLNEMYKNGEISLTDYNSQLRTYQQGQRDSIKSANEAKKSLVAYVKQGLDAQNDALSDAIDKKKKLLETEKDLHDFQSKIADQNKNIAKIEKQIAALESDDSEENRKKLQQLKSNLQDAQKDREDTLYDRSISDQEDSLDKMLENSKKQAEDYLKDTNKVFSDALTYVNANSSQVASNIEKIAKDTGYDISSYIVNAWEKGGSAVGDYASTLSSNIPNITAQLGLIASSWQSICDAADRAAEASAKYAETKVTDTQGIGSSNDSGTSSGNGSGSSGNNNADKQQELNKLRKKASDITEWISKHSVSATHKKSYYGALNQYLYDKQHGQVLSKADEIALAKKLGVSVKSDLSGKNDREKIASALKKLIKDASFSTGGVIKDLVKLSGEDGISFLQRGKAVLSKEQTQALLNFKPVIPQIDSIIGNLKNIPIEKVSSQSPTYQIDNRTIVEGVATDQIVKQMEGVAQKQAENVVRKINQATYAKGVRR